MALRDRLPLPRPKREPDYSLTIVNIVLLLIFFFLVAGQMTTAPSIPVQLSETARLPIEALPKPILIWEADDAITLDEVEDIYQGDLEQTVVLGGQDPEITIFWGDEDAGKVTDINSTAAGWDYSF